MKIPEPITLPNINPTPLIRPSCFFRVILDPIDDLAQSDPVMPSLGCEELDSTFFLLLDLDTALEQEDMIIQSKAKYNKLTWLVLLARANAMVN